MLGFFVLVVGFGWVFIAARGFSLLAVLGGFSLEWLLVAERGSGAPGFSSPAWGCSSCSWQALGHRRSSWDARAKLPRGHAVFRHQGLDLRPPWAWSLPAPGVGPVSPMGMAGQALTTGPPGQFEVIFEVEVITEVISEKG